MLIIFIATIIYQGGHRFDPYFPYYSFPLNYLSDLGRTRNFQGEPNIAPRILFSSALIISGIGLIVFFILNPFFFRENKKTYQISLAGTIIGILSSVFCITTAFLPLDLFETIHRACVIVLGIIEVPAMILIVVAIFREKKYPNVYAWIFLVYIFIKTTYIVLFASLGFDSPWRLEAIKIIGQKIVIFLQVVNLIIQAFGARKLLLSTYREQPLDNNQAVS